MPIRWGLPPDPQGVVAEAPQQLSALSLTATEAIVMSTTQWKATPGRYYVMRTSNLHWQSSVATDITLWAIRVAQNGAAASVSAGRVACATSTANIANLERGDANWLHTFENNLSGLCIATLTVYRLAGTGTCSVPAQTSIRARQLWVEDRGT
jgi:hypothetical protein